MSIHEFDPKTLRIALAMALCLGLVACEEEGDDDDSAPTGAEFDVTVTLSELIPTVATVEFSTDAADGDEAYVEFGLDDGYGMRAPAAAVDGGWQAVLIGMKPSMDYHFRPAVVAADGDVAGGDESLTTGPVHPDLPDLTIEALDEDRATGGFFVMSLLSTPSAAVIVDEDGEYVWWHQESTTDFPVPRVLLSHDRSKMLYLGRLADEEEDYEHYIFQVSLDGETVETRTVHDAHHDFTELPDGTFAVITHDRREVQGEEALGDRVVEYYTDGTEADIWSVWDHLDYDPEGPVDPGTAWSHSNALDYSAEEDVYYISVRNFDTIFGFERDTGDVFRTLGGVLSDYELAPEDGEWFDKEHQFQVIGDEVLVFANGVDVVNGSRVLGYQLDDDAGVATNHWDYRAEFPLFCYTYGDVNRLSSGNVLVTWSTAGQMEEVTEDGEIVWQLKAALGGGFGYTTHMESLYP